MTNQDIYELKVEMTDLDDVYAEARYESVRVGPGPDFFLELGEYLSGDGVADAGDSLSFYGKGDTRFQSADDSTIVGCPDKQKVGW